MIKLGVILVISILGGIYYLANIGRRVYLNSPSYVVPVSTKWQVLVVHTLTTFAIGASFVNIILKSWGRISFCRIK
jgi:hypothetical protein